MLSTVGPPITVSDHLVKPAAEHLGRPVPSPHPHTAKGEAQAVMFEHQLYAAVKWEAKCDTSKAEPLGGWTQPSLGQAGWDELGGVFEAAPEC